MNEPAFENWLRRQPLRKIPTQWREQVLEQMPRPSPQPARPQPAGPAPWWRELLWPSPAAWAGVAAAWVLILGLNAGSGGFSPGSPQSATSTATPRSAIAFQRALQTLMMDLAEPGEAEPPEPPAGIRPRGSSLNLPPSRRA